MWSRMTRLLCALALLVPLDAAAEVGRQFEAEVGFGQLDEDWLLTTRLGLLWFDEVEALGCRGELDAAGGRCVAPVRAALGIPMRLEVIDEQPADDEIVRTEDWDDPGDFFRLVRFVQYGEPHQALHLRTGELGAIILGHATIANGYLNSVTVGDFNPGITTGANTAYGGLQLFLDDVTRPAVFGLRGHVRPWGFGERGFAHRVAFGASVVSDFTAPLLVKAGDPVRGQPLVAERTSFAVAGVDAELTALDTGRFELLTYADVNFALGLGGHLGATFRVAFDEHWTASLRAEGRLLGSEYIPDYFGPLYQIERASFTGWGTDGAAPKARVAATRQGLAAGGLVQFDLRWREFLAVSVGGSEHGGAGNASAWARVGVTPPGPFTAGVYWARPNGELEDLARLDGALLAAEARFTVWGPLYLHGRYDRLFRLTEAGDYLPAVEWTSGVGCALPF